MVVLTKYCEMDDDGSRNKRSFIRRMFWSPAPQRPSPLISNPPPERRPLRSVPCSGPQYKVDPDVLVKDFVEKETKYMGTIDDVCMDFDTNDRCSLLSIVDEKRKVNQLPRLLSYKNDVIMSFSVHDIKISCRDGEELIHRIPTHKIASTGFIQDGREVILFIKFGSKINSDMCNISFFSCESREGAEELCSLTHQLFQLVYTQSTMEFFDKSIQDGASTPKHHSYSTDDSVDKRNTIKLSTVVPVTGVSANGSTLSHELYSSHRTSPVDDTAIINEGENSKISSPSSAPSSMHRSHNHSNSGIGFSSPISSASTPSSPSGSSRRRKNRRSESSSGSYSHTSTHQLQLKEYIAVLKERLTSEELSRFAQDLHHFRTRGLPIEQFCEHLMQIYQEHRKSLLLGMRHFIPDSCDRAYFEQFLLEHNVTTIEDDTKQWWGRHPDSRTTSETEESSAHSNPMPLEHMTEMSSGSDQTSAASVHSHSDELEAVMSGVEQFQLGDIDSSTLKHEQTDQPSSSQSCHDNDIMIGNEEGDSPLLRSGENSEPYDPNLLSPRRNVNVERQTIFKRKSRGKSPSATEFGAPYPSIAVEESVETEDAKPNETKLKKTKKKVKEKSLTSDKDTKKKRKSKKTELSGQQSDELLHDKQTTIVPEPAQYDDVIPASVTSQPKPEHRKKKRHKHVAVGVVTHL
uniref:Malcavernin n=1 Tax=Phallusia mammillata TaxID=59560 RepID=A0A6F9D9H1_9ASCI|nr:malcavernin [Phallusia mammillata]